VYRDDRPETVDAQVREYLALPSDPAPPSEWFVERFDGARQAGELGTLMRRLWT
jgi:hypothetical protein